MSRKNISVILIMILVGFICAGNSESKTGSEPSIQTNNTTNGESTRPDSANNEAKAETNATDTAASTTHCVLIEFRLEVNLTVKTDDNQTINRAITITEKNVGKTETQSCAKSDQQLTMSWGKESSVEITFKFKTNAETNTTYMLSKIDLFINISEEFSSSKAKAGQTVKLNYTSSNDDFKTPIGKSYSCGKNKILRFTDSSNGNKTVSVTLSNVHLEAYRNDDNSKFSPSTCLEIQVSIDNGNTTLILAIVCPLLAIIVLALIGFFIYRRRAQGRGCGFSGAACARD